MNENFCYHLLWKLLLLASVELCCNGLQAGEFLGCYKMNPSSEVTSNDCVSFCSNKFYKYAAVSLSSCMCLNVVSELNSTSHCKDVCVDCGVGADLMDVYYTASVVPRPPRNLQISDVTNTSLYLSWEEPESYIDISTYQVKAVVLHTYSSYKPATLDWIFFNDTFKAQLISLQPATKYEITVQAVSLDGEGVLASSIAHTLLGDPDNLPPQPTVKEKGDTYMLIKLESIVNNNGPVSSYQVIVIDENERQGFQPEYLTSFQEAKRGNLNYYIAAEVDPKDFDKDFTVGDGKMYGNYYNAPLTSQTDYNIILALVSRLNDSVKVVYSETSAMHHGVIILNVVDDSGPSVVLIVMSVAIALLSCLLLLGLVVFFVIRQRVMNHRRRLTGSQELTLQGPMIEIENSGYIPEEEYQPVNHYRNLKQKVKTIPHHLLTVNSENLLGAGRFGVVHSGSITDGDRVAVYPIADKALRPEDKRNMLKELDVLIRAENHNNVSVLIGTSETSDTVYVVLEYSPMNLKTLLLDSRECSSGRFSRISEPQIFNILAGIAKGMDHLVTNKIIHKQLCARNVMITDSFIPKIFGFGLQQYYQGKSPDCTRWTSIEVFKNLPHTSKSDVWSFACLMWEVVTLGATPYGNVLNNSEIPVRVVKGLRLSQLCYTSSNLYQLMLNCWQLDMDERPHFRQLVSEIENLLEDGFVQNLSFNWFPDFQYEQFYPDLECVKMTAPETGF